MIDGLKLVTYSPHYAEVLRGKAYLDFDCKANENTGELRYSEARHKNIFIKAYPNGRVEFRGSIQKFCTSNNYKDFTYSQLLQGFAQFCNEFDVNGANVSIENLEWGVNITTNCTPFTFLDGLICHKLKPFSEMKGRQGLSHSTIGKVFNHAQYEYKLYDKGLQCGLAQDTNLLRLELRAKRMAFLKKAEFLTLSDFQDKRKIVLLGHELEKQSNSIVFAPQISFTNLTKREIALYTECSNPYAWKKFTPKQRKHRVSALRSINAKSGQQELLNSVKIASSQKWLQLLES